MLNCLGKTYQRKDEIKETIVHSDLRCFCAYHNIFNARDACRRHQDMMFEVFQDTKSYYIFRPLFLVRIIFYFRNIKKLTKFSILAI